MGRAMRNTAQSRNAALERNAPEGVLFFRSLRLQLPGGNSGRWIWCDLQHDDLEGSKLIVRGPAEHREVLAGIVGAVVTVAADQPHDAPYVASARVEHVTDALRPRLELRLTSPWQRNQRRQAVRLDVAIKPREVLRLTQHGTEPLLDLTIVDISALGVLLQGKYPLSRGDQLQIAFTLSEQPDEFNLRAEVVRVGAHFEDARRFWRSGCRFVDISASVSDAIFRFIFDQQRMTVRGRQRR